jgi:hypothetical protein
VDAETDGAELKEALVSFGDALDAASSVMLTASADGLEVSIGAKLRRISANVRSQGSTSVDPASLLSRVKGTGSFRLRLSGDGQALEVSDHSGSMTRLPVTQGAVASSRTVASAITYPGSGLSQTRHPQSQRFAVLPWAYVLADTVAVIAVIASVLSVIGGIVLAIVLSKYTTVDEFSGATTKHHGGVVMYWLFAGVLTAALWMAVAVVVKLLADIGQSLRDAGRTPAQ